MVAHHTSVVVALLLALSLAAVGGCETEKAYATCELDKEVTSKNICSGASGASTDNSTSCVVRSHPHCVEHVCLSYYSRQAICTRICGSDGDCTLDGVEGTCWEFASATDAKAAERYCVPSDAYYESLSSQ